MVEERITTVEGGTAPATHTTIIHDGEPARRGGGGATMMIVLVLLVAVIGGLYLFNRSTSSQSAKDNAVASAASSVGDAATKVGDAAQSAADKVTDK